MVKLDLTGCDSFVAKEQYDKYLKCALAAQKVLQEESGAGNDFLGWQHLPSSIGKAGLDDCLSVVDRWLEREIDLVVVIGIGGSYLGAKAAIEALSHSFVTKAGFFIYRQNRRRSRRPPPVPAWDRGRGRAWALRNPIPASARRSAR